jgi:adenylyltransferase/sulfurtransferase
MTTTQVLIPAPLRAYTEQRKTVEIAESTVGRLLGKLVETYPDLKAQLYDAEGKLRRFVNVYVRDEDIRYLENDRTALRPGDVVSLVPSVSGG